ncbi:MAG: DciA family protein [Propionibacteriaceae bacterium]|jgi:predicted nucleic acid-binding Zn ribbon protein|nr:DciA family protein [Propionibacteriaceae bacterium]
MSETPHDEQGLEVARAVAARAAQRAPKKRRRTGGSSGIQPIAEVLTAVAFEEGWDEQLSVRALLSDWAALVGPANAEHSKPEAYADGVLTVRAESTAWATSLRQIAHQLVAILNDKLGQGSVTRVEVLGPKAPSWKHGKRSVPGRGPRDTYG